MLLVLLLPVIIFAAGVQSFVLEGSRTSYAQFRKWYASENASLEFEFRTQQPNGVLLYTDDGGYYDFLELKLVDGGLRIRLNLGNGPQVLVVGSGLNDGLTWHSVKLTRRSTRTHLVLDNNEAAVLPDDSRYAAAKRPSSYHVLSSGGGGRGDNRHFGNFTTNSYVYVGGLPSWYTTKLSSLALPSVVFEPRFRGAIRNLVYADDEAGVPRRQEVMAYKGVRASTVDACEHHNPCHNGGICISTDGGPVCECRYIDYKGTYCEQGTEPPEATFNGNEFLSYDLLQLGGEPILSTHDEVSLHFRTNRADGLLFYSGDGEDYLNLAIKDGGVSLSINLGSGRLDTGIRPKTNNIRFDDDEWHHVVISRAVQEQSHARSLCHGSMTVDATYTEKWRTAGTFSMLASNKVFIGGSSEPYKLPGTDTKNNFVGCLKKVEFKADSLHLPLLKLAKEGNRLMTTVGFISYQCKPAEPIMPVAFTSEEAHAVLPTWNNTFGGSLSFKFRTNEKTGLILFNHGSTPGQGDFFGIELLEGYLYMHLDLGSGSSKTRASNRRLDDGAWHKVDIVRNQKAGTVTVDNDRVAFETPGDAISLELASPLYVGGVDTDLEAVYMPPSLWSASIKKGFVGCFRDLVVNGFTLDVAEFAKQQDSGSIRSSCHIEPPKCGERPCLHGGQCSEGWNRFVCDCTATSFTGPTCGRAAASVQFDGSQHLTFSNPGSGVSEAENLSFRFRSRHGEGLLVATRDETSADRLELYLMRGRLHAAIHIGLSEKVAVAGDGLGDDLWHTVTLDRKGMIVTLTIDDDKPVMAEIFGSESLLDYSSLHIGAILPRDLWMRKVRNFEGFIAQLKFNGVEYLDRMKSGLLTQDFAMTATLRQVDDIVHHPVTFRNKQTYLGLPQMPAYFDISVNFRFRTLEANGLIMYNAGKGMDFLAVELLNGHLHYILNLGYGVISLKDNVPVGLNDNEWHTVTIGRPSKYKHTLLVDSHLAATNSRGDNLHLDLDGILFLGGVKSVMYGMLPKQILSTFGFQGCLANLDVNGATYNPIKSPLVPSDHVSEGCEEFPGVRVTTQDSKALAHKTSSKCTKHTCYNSGVCLDHWVSPACDCDLTSFTGPSCSDESVAYEWGPQPGLIRYLYSEDSRPDTRADMLSVGFITPLENAVLARVSSESSNDYLELEIVGGNVFVSYNLGTQDIAIGEMNIPVNDGAYHVVRFTRSGANSTLQVDDYQVQTKYPQGHQLIVFNSQSELQMGGKWNPTLNRVERPFEGVLAGIVYNGLRPLDLAAGGDRRTKVLGGVRVLDSIPFDYKERHKRLFGRSRKNGAVHHVQHTNPSMLPEPGNNDELIIGRASCDDDDYADPRCFSYEGSGDELITPIYIAPTRPPWKVPPTFSEDNVDLCDDEEDCHQEEGSGSIDNYGTTASPFYATTTSTSSEVWPPWRDPDEEVPPRRPTLQPFPTEATNRPQVIYENYDTKYNLYDSEPEPKNPTDEGGGHHVTEAASPGTVLVIGIIAGALIAVVLIIIIVLKMRTRVEGAYKVDETRTYQFAGDETGFEASTAAAGVVAAPGTKATVTPAGSGFYDKYVNNNKKQGGKQVREWYV